MGYPSITDYQDAVQDPRNTFTDPELMAGRISLSPLGLPQPMSGGFALTYRMHVGAKDLAVRCFHREVPQARERYSRISAKLRTINSPYFVGFDFQNQGICLSGKYYPIVKMEWVAGDTLGAYLDKNATNPNNITNLRQQFSDLADFLEKNKIAHGDIQNENVIISGRHLRLVDYDGMFVSGMVEGRGSEIGQRNFQHPRRTEGSFGPKMDRFSFIIMDVSLEALSLDPSLYRKYGSGGLAIVFKANDFCDPSSSEIFCRLSKDHALSESIKKLINICKSSIDSIPTLAEFRTGIGIPSPNSIIIDTSRGSRSRNYIGAFLVADAKDFEFVLQQVGDKIELIGKIDFVKEGVGKESKYKGKPYVFINFGAFVGDSVRITIWSEGLQNLIERPSVAWRGRWISATGLIEPPFKGSRHGKAYRKVGITVTSGNEVVLISEQEAMFRLGQRRHAAQDQATEKGRTSVDITDCIDSSKMIGSSPIASPRGSGPQIVQFPTPTVKTAPGGLTANQLILRGIRSPQTQQLNRSGVVTPPGNATPVGSRSSQTSNTQPVAPPSVAPRSGSPHDQVSNLNPVQTYRRARVPFWVVVCGALLSLLILLIVVSREHLP